MKYFVLNYVIFEDSTIRQVPAKNILLSYSQPCPLWYLWSSLYYLHSVSLIDGFQLFHLSLKMSFELNPITREFFSVIYSQAFCPNCTFIQWFLSYMKFPLLDEFISVCNNFGEVFALPVYESKDCVPPRRIKFDTNVYSLLTLRNSNLLICGSENGLLQGLDWTQLTARTNGDFESKFSFTVNQREINSICSINNEKQFVAGYGDGHLSFHAVDRPDKVTYLASIYKLMIGI